MSGGALIEVGCPSPSQRGTELPLKRPNTKEKPSYPRQCFKRAKARPAGSRLGERLSVADNMLGTLANTIAPYQVKEDKGNEKQ